ncbi:MAG: phosphatidylserine decarboxylase [Pseudomonadales bacterium]|nr:phosphatidylserine decarboxylase [Pseudomonadales bacterium]
MKNRVFIFAQYLTPQHALSRAAGFFAKTENPSIKHYLITTFANTYNVNMEEALEPDLKQYKNFNAFFTRQLKPNARPIDNAANSFASPADGAISQLGQINVQRIFQAKGHDYQVKDLLGGNESLSELFLNGSFATVYLSPKDYHRVHMPIDGTLKEMLYIPGDLFSVNTATSENVPNLFARNERVVCIFETEYGPMAIILVGAMIVAGIETVWAGEVAPAERKLAVTHYNQDDLQDIRLKKGEEMGRFKLGSTVILLFGENKVVWDSSLKEGAAVRMGESMGAGVEAEVNTGNGI